MTLERGTGLTLWRQIEQQLAAEIGAGVFTPANRLPTETVLAARFGVNRHTLRQAVNALAERGLVRVEQGRGTFVQEAVIDYAIGRRTRLSEIVSRHDRSPSGRLLAARTERTGTAVAEALGIPVRSRCLTLETLREADGIPIAIGTHHLPANRFAGLAEAFETAGSLSAAFAEFGIGDYERRTTKVTARMPTAEEARLLQQPRSRPVLVSAGIDAEPHGLPFHYVVTRFPSDRVQLVVNP
ncbi:MAG: phosphonate metabolism transcriptional regulator PhnF [Alphaproteobacteria bacterium]